MKKFSKTILAMSIGLSSLLMAGDVVFDKVIKGNVTGQVKSIKQLNDKLLEINLENITKDDTGKATTTNITLRFSNDHKTEAEELLNYGSLAHFTGNFRSKVSTSKTDRTQKHLLNVIEIDPISNGDGDVSSENHTEQIGLVLDNARGTVKSVTAKNEKLTEVLFENYRKVGKTEIATHLTLKFKGQDLAAEARETLDPGTRIIVNGILYGTAQSGQQHKVNVINFSKI